MNIIEFINNTVQRTFSKYDERFSVVAESGSYSDLSNKPTIPEAYDDTALAARVTAVEDGKASLQVAAIPGGGGGEEINALVSQGENSVSVSYYKDGALPNTLNFNVDSDYFTIPATGYVDQKAAETQNNAQVYTDLKLTQKQNTLVSGTNIKTVNGESILGSGNMEIGGSGTVDAAMSDTSENAVQNKVIKAYVDDVPIGVNFEVGAERWYGTYTDENGVTYQVYSKMIYIPALPAVAGIETYSHGISGIKQILQVYGFTTDGFVLNAPRQNAQDNIAIYQMSKSATNQTLSIEVGKDRSNKAAYVCLVYAKNN